MGALANAKHERLVQEYLVDLNQTQAAIRAGYSPQTAGSQASELFKKPNIRARVEEMQAERSVRVGVNQDRVIRELARIAFANAPDFIDATNATLHTGALPDDTAAIASVRVKRKDAEDFTEVEREIRLCDKVKSLELLGKHLGMFADRLIVTDRPEIIDDVP